MISQTQIALHEEVQITNDLPYVLIYEYKNDEHFMSLVEEYAPSYIDSDTVLMSLYILRDREELLIEELQTLQTKEDKLNERTE